MGPVQRIKWGLCKVKKSGTNKVDTKSLSNGDKSDLSKEDK